MKALIGAIALLFGSAVLHLWAGGAFEIDVIQMLRTGPQDFEQILFWQAQASRFVMALAIGAALGLSGAVMQEVTQNPIVSPTTLGTAAGAWLALVLAASFMPSLFGVAPHLIAMTGGLLTSAAVLAIAGLNRMGGLHIIIVGMAMNVFLGGIAMVLVLLDTETVRRLFIWGAGDLTQADWRDVIWVAPRLVFILPIALLLTRGLMLLRLGAEQARARGLAVMPFLALSISLAVWSTSAAITTVGLIGFIGMIAPNLARMLGASRSIEVVILSTVLGASALLATDSLPLILDDYVKELVPSGSAAALIGAPVLLLLVFRYGKQLSPFAASAQHDKRVLPSWAWAALGLTLICATIGALLISLDADGVVWWPRSSLVFELRWPRVFAAMGAGMAMGICGVLLQRLLRNPLASPDIVGLTSGATLGVVSLAIYGDMALRQAAIPGALAGAFLAMCLLITINRSASHATAIMILTGIALAAGLDALIQFILSHAGDSGFSLLSWLAGSTAGIQAPQALLLSFTALAFLAICVARHRSLDLIEIGPNTARAAGVSVRKEREVLLGISALLAGLATAIVGPLSFVGLIAPHAAKMLGASRARPQLFMSAGLGAGLMVISDHLGRVLLFPDQLPAGTFASLIGGGYLFGLIVVLRRTE